ncbi:MAG: type II toxin-antitoxin system HicB family antitoxin [Clostridiales Family XIII bacterium]|jgi:predicted RNase H-like HicB family nuclease|nr:type II toxin-antitoxin system HicB family antitoxin [Clostridiales Family XIII bacterium]
MNVSDYMNLPYNIITKRISDESGTYYFATVLELDGCMSDGRTITEAYENIQEAMAGWIETKLEGGFSVPVPFEADKYSGKFVLRIPKSLHARLAMEAEKEGVSLNQYSLYRLSM